MPDKKVLFKGQKSEALGIVIYASLIVKILKYKIFEQKMKIPKATEALQKLQ